MVTRNQRWDGLPTQGRETVPDSNTQRALTGLVTTIEGVLKFLEPWVNPDPWHLLTYLNSWGDYSGTYPRGQYRKDPSGRVWLRGMVRRSVAGFVGFPITVLPKGYRPKLTHSFMVQANNSWCYVIVRDTGSVEISTSGTATPEAFTSLDSISFDTV